MKNMDIAAIVFLISFILIGIPSLYWFLKKYYNFTIAFCRFEIGVYTGYCDGKWISIFLGIINVSWCY